MKKVLIGVTGSISAYKVCDLIRMLQNCDFIDVDIDIVMTQSACELASPLTFSALIGHDVYVDVFDNFNDPIPHIKLANQSDVICVCPASANTIAKIAHGFADNLLTSTILASNKPLIICPAMNDVMYDMTPVCTTYDGI
ncbi:MAG: hypothetical protein MJ189_05700, partial [Coriobacteriales bacterium]|nr:hypothetical protein [Coriobacteriales bacterium]